MQVLSRLEKWLSNKLAAPITLSLVANYDVAYVVPFGVSEGNHTLPSSQSRAVLDRLRCDLAVGIDIHYIHVGGGFPKPSTCECESVAASRYLTNDGEIAVDRIRSEDQSWDTGDNAWHFRQCVIRNEWKSVCIYVVKEQSKRALADFREYLQEKYVGWPVTIDVAPIDCADWSDNIKPCLRNKWGFMLYEVLKIMLRSCGFTFMYRHSPTDT